MSVLRDERRSAVHADLEAGAVPAGLEAGEAGPFASLSDEHEVDIALKQVETTGAEHLSD